MNETYNLIIEKLKETKQEEIERVLDILEGKYTCNSNRRVFLNWNEIKEMKSAGIHFGSHTCSHNQLTRLNSAEVKYELKESRYNINKHGIECSSIFCYPNGSYNENIKKQVEEEGYSSAVTTRYGIINPVLESKMFELKRIGIHNDISSNIINFAFHISGYLKREK